MCIRDSGRDAVIYTDKHDFTNYPLIGSINRSIECWKINGKYSHYNSDHDYDLVSPTRKIVLKRWARLMQHNGDIRYDVHLSDRGMPDVIPFGSRLIAVKEIKIEFEEGEGL